MRMQLAKEALKQALWSSGPIDFSHMTDDEVEELWYAAGELSRQARIERSHRLRQRIDANIARVQLKDGPEQVLRNVRISLVPVSEDGA